jgi:tetratricopeptide (TPR) repeat protein
MLGIYYRNKSRFNQATILHNKALQLAIKADHKELQVVSLNMLGVINRHTDNIRKALDYHQQALTIAEAEPEITLSLKKSIAVSLNSMGNIYLPLNQLDLALEKFEKSLSIETENGNILGMAINNQNIGYVLEEFGEYDKALKKYQTSLTYNKQINSSIGIVICNNSIGQILLKQGKPQEALKIIKPTLDLAIKNDNQLYIASSYINLGWAQINTDHLEEGEKNLLKGLDIAKEYNFKTYISDAYYHLSNLNEKKGNFALALQQYKQGDVIFHSISNQQNSQYVNALRIQYESEKKNSQIRALANENEIVKLRLKESQRNWLAIVFGIIILAAIPLIINRQRRLKDEKQILTLEQDMLRSQMNPHFIFNSLNSIKLYIINNEKENAVYYLNKFSKLIRKILIASKEKRISLADELETMKLYMNIENIRFSNEINYTTKVDESIDLESVKVPSLILQPFLENALWHGLSTKKDNKNINLEITKNNNGFVTITITDNGIGRKESERINSNKLLKRKSVGIAITNERLANFFKGHQDGYSIEIKDLYDTNQNPAGTRVIINIPIENFPKLKTA